MSLLQLEKYFSNYRYSRELTLRAIALKYMKEKMMSAALFRLKFK